MTRDRTCNCGLPNGPHANMCRSGKLDLRAAADAREDERRAPSDWSSPEAKLERAGTIRYFTWELVEAGLRVGNDWRPPLQADIARVLLAYRAALAVVTTTAGEPVRDTYTFTESQRDAIEKVGSPCPECEGTGQCQHWGLTIRDSRLGKYGFDAHR